MADKTILIVDDDEIYAYALSRLLRSCGYTRDRGRQHGGISGFGQVDLVITDLRLHAGEPHGASLAG